MNSNVPARLISQLLLEEADLRDLVEEFVSELPRRLSELRQAFERLDWSRLISLAHQLKGAAGSYGYPDISAVAAAMESAFRTHHAECFGQWASELERLTAAASAGLELS